MKTKRLFCMLIACAMAVTAGLAMTSVKAEASTTRTVYVTGTQSYQNTNKVLKQINKERSKRGLRKLKLDKSLTKSAIKRAEETAIYIPDTSPHKRPDGRLGRGINSRSCYEICAQSYGYVSASEIVSGWMNSPTHRAGILLSNARSAGIGCVSIEYNDYWCVEFSNTKAQSKVTAKNKKRITSKVRSKTKYTQSSYFKLSCNNVQKGSKTKCRVYFQGRTKYNRLFPAVPINAKSFSWKSSNKAVATVNSKGVVTGKKPGKVTISATLKNGKKFTKKTKVRVTNAYY